MPRRDFRQKVVDVPKEPVGPVFFQKPDLGMPQLKLCDNFPAIVLRGIVDHPDDVGNFRPLQNGMQASLKKNPVVSVRNDDGDHENIYGFRLFER